MKACELLAISIRPHYLPHQFSVSIGVNVYSPTSDDASDCDDPLASYTDYRGNSFSLYDTHMDVKWLQYYLGRINIWQSSMVV